MRDNGSIVKMLEAWKESQFKDREVIEQICMYGKSLELNERESELIRCRDWLKTNLHVDFKKTTLKKRALLDIDKAFDSDVLRYAFSSDYHYINFVSDGDLPNVQHEKSLRYGYFAKFLFWYLSAGFLLAYLTLASKALDSTFLLFSCIGFWILWADGFFLKFGLFRRFIALQIPDSNNKNVTPVRNFITYIMIQLIRYGVSVGLLGIAAYFIDLALQASLEHSKFGLAAGCFIGLLACFGWIAYCLYQFYVECVFRVYIFKHEQRDLNKGK